MTTSMTTSMTTYRIGQMKPIGESDVNENALGLVPTGDQRVQNHAHDREEDGARIVRRFLQDGLLHLLRMIIFGDRCSVIDDVMPFIPLLSNAGTSTAAEKWGE